MVLLLPVGCAWARPDSDPGQHHWGSGRSHCPHTLCFTHKWGSEARWCLATTSPTPLSGCCSTGGGLSCPDMPGIDGTVDVLRAMGLGPSPSPAQSECAGTRNLGSHPGHAVHLQSRWPEEGGLSHMP